MRRREVRWSVRRARCVAAGLFTLAAATPAGPSPAAAKGGGSVPADPFSNPRRDPNEAPFMPPLHGGARPDGARLYPAEHTGPYGRRQRLRLTVEPVYASLRAGLTGRPAPATNPQRGAGVGAAADLRIWRPLGLRASGTFSAHVLKSEFTLNDDGERVQTAPNGTLQVGYAALSALYAMDAGPLLPTLELGLGPLWVQTPDGVADGQTGQACLDNGACDLGLTCDAATNACRPSATMAVHAGLSVDLDVGRRWALGAGIRYFALVSDPQTYPVYLQASLRLGLRL